MTRQGPRRLVTELRVHGVGGSPGPALLGYDHEREIVQVWTRNGVTVRERKDSSLGRVQGFDWGELNSSSRFHAAWVFLAPFTLLNAAGWSFPRPTKRRDVVPARAAHALVLVLGWLLTLVTAAWVAEILIDHVGYQWLASMLTGGRAEGDAWDLLFWTVKISTYRARMISVGVAGVATMILFCAAWVVAGRARGDVDEPTRHDHPFTGRSDLQDPGFFGRRPSWAASMYLHLTLVAGVVVLAIAQGALAAETDRSRTDADEIVGIAEAAQITTLVLLLLVAAVIRSITRKPGAALGWSLLTVASVVTGAFFAGLEIWLLRLMNADEDAASEVDSGTHLIPADVYFWIVTIGVGIVIATVASRRLLRGLPRTCEAGATPLPPWWVRRVRSAQASARVVHTIDRFAFAFAAVVVGVTAVFAVNGATTLIDRIRGGPDPGVETGPVVDAAAWLLVGGVTFVLARARKAALDNRVRRFIGQAWDALAFWPRRFHPFAVRPYTHIAVPELRAHLASLREEGPVVVSAHSQGSALAAVAILQLEDANRIGLVTYGSHLGTLYRRAFPSYFGHDFARTLRERLQDAHGVRWRNLYRLTDPIGGPIMEACSDDVCLPDPATAPATANALDPPLEMDRMPWTDLAVHSHYLRERGVKHAVAEMKARVAPHGLRRAAPR